jgi:AraC-like DNA-binding protein
LETILVFGIIFEIVIGSALLVYPLLTNKGEKASNILFSALVLMLIFQSGMFMISVLSDNGHGIFFFLWLVGLSGIGPVYYLFTKSLITENLVLNYKFYIHLTPIVIVLTLWLTVGSLQTDFRAWNIYHRSIMLVSIAYLSQSVYSVNYTRLANTKIRNQLNIISVFFMLLWLTSMLHEISGLRYLTGALLFTIFSYFVFRIQLNKGTIIDTTITKYKNTGLKENEKERITELLVGLFVTEKIYKDNTISIGKVAKRINTSTHSLSQVINEKYQHSFFDLISRNRIKEAKKILNEDSNIRISDVAYDVGYNSLSAFNTTFKKLTGCTPSQYRNGK